MREVLRTLENDGLVQRVHGVGTFVTRTETAVTSRFDLDLGVTEAVLAGAGAARYEGGSVHRFLEERCGLELAGGIADMTAIGAGRGLARQLGVSPGAALLRMEQVERTADELAVLYSREHHVPTVFNLSVGRVRRRGSS